MFENNDPLQEEYDSIWKAYRNRKISFEVANKLSIPIRRTLDERRKERERLHAEYYRTKEDWD